MRYRTTLRVLVGRPSHQKYCAMIIRRFAMVSRSTWDILSYDETGLKTSYDDLRCVNYGCLWTIGRWILYSSCDVIRRRSHRRYVYDVMAILGITRSSRDITRSHAMSRLFISYFYMFSPARPSHDVVPWSCDVLRHRPRLYDHRTTLIVFLRWFQLLGSQS